MSEWVIVNGHVLGQCAYLNSDDLDEPCDCRDHDAFWGPRGDDDDDQDVRDEPGDLAYEGSW